MLIRKQYNNPKGNIPGKMIFEPILGKSLHFDENDLILNRDNLLSDHQKQRFDTLPKIKLPRILYNSLFYRMISVGIIILALILMIRNGETETLINLALVVGGIALATIILAFGITLERYVNSINLLKQTIEAGIVRTQSGTITLEKRKQKGDKTEKCFLIVNEVEFHLSPEAFTCFKHLEPYTIYYIQHMPKAKIIVSAEPIE